MKDVAITQIKERIQLMRGQWVMLDAELAALDVRCTDHLNQSPIAVARR